MASCRARCFDVALRSGYRVAVVPEKNARAHAAPVLPTAPRGRVPTRRHGLCALPRARTFRCCPVRRPGFRPSSSSPRVSPGASPCLVVAACLAPSPRAGPSCRHPPFRSRLHFGACRLRRFAPAPAPAAAVVHHVGQLRGIQPWGGVVDTRPERRDATPGRLERPKRVKPGGGARESEPSHAILLAVGQQRDAHARCSAYSPSYVTFCDSSLLTRLSRRTGWYSHQDDFVGNISLNGVVVSSSGYTGGFPFSLFAPLSVPVAVAAGTNTLQMFNVYNREAPPPNPAGLLFTVANAITGVTFAVSSAVAGPTQSATTDCAASSVLPTQLGTYVATDGSCAVVACPSPPPCSVFVAAGVCSVTAPAVPCPPSPPSPPPFPPFPPSNDKVVCPKVTNRWPLSGGYASGSTVLDTVGNWTGVAYGGYRYISGAAAPFGAIAFDGLSGYVQVGPRAGAFGGPSAFRCTGRGN